MKNRTFTLTVPAGRDAVFGFFSNPENLPVWATEFCQGIERAGDLWKIQTCSGEMFFDIIADPETGIADMLAGPAPDQMSTMEARIVGSADGPTSATFSFQQQPDCPDEMYERQCRSLRAELTAAGERFGGGTVAIAGMSPSAYTGIIVKDPRNSQEFYAKHLGFTAMYESDAYVHLHQAANDVQLALLKAGDCDQMKEFETATDGNGLWLGLEVADADAEHDRLKQAGVEIAQPPTDQPWGERTVVIRDPDGVLVYIAHKIPVPEPAAVAA